MHQKTTDWFLTSAMLSHPLLPSAKRMAIELAVFSEAIDHNVRYEVRNSLQHLRQSELPIRLERYLACSRVKNPLPHPMDENWLYLLRANEEWGVVNLGTIEGKLEQTVAEMDELNRDLAPYGISAAWSAAKLVAVSRQDWMHHFA